MKHKEYCEGKVTFEKSYARTVDVLDEAEWGLPAFANKDTSVPLIIDLFSTFPTINRNRAAITYPTARNSIANLAYQYLNKDHIMLGTPLDKEGNFRADRDTTLGTILASRFADEPDGEPTVFIEKPVTAQILGVIWPLTEFGGQVAQKMRNAVAVGDKLKIGASFELWYRDIGFILNNKVYQRGISESEEDIHVLEAIESTLGYSSDGMLMVTAAIGGQWPTLLYGGANGVVLFHGAAIIVDEDPAYPETAGQFQIFAKRTEQYLQAVCKAGADEAPEVTMKELEAAIAKLREDLLAEIKKQFAAANTSGDAPDPAKVLETALAKADEAITKAVEALTAKFDEALAKAAKEAEEAIRAKVKAESEASAAVLAFAAEKDIAVKPKADMKENERAFARETFDEWLKTPETALAMAKAAAFDMPLLPKRDARSSVLPAGGDDGLTADVKTPEQCVEEAK